MASGEGEMFPSSGEQVMPYQCGCGPSLADLTMFIAQGLPLPGLLCKVADRVAMWACSPAPDRCPFAFPWGTVLGYRSQRYEIVFKGCL